MDYQNDYNVDGQISIEEDLNGECDENNYTYVIEKSMNL